MCCCIQICDEYTLLFLDSEGTGAVGEGETTKETLTNSHKPSLFISLLQGFEISEINYVSEQGLNNIYHKGS